MQEKKIISLLVNLFKNFYLEMQECVKLSELDISMSEFTVLREIKLIDQCTASNISVNTSTDKALVARILKRLIKKKLIFKKKNPNDKRSQLLLLTKSGHLKLNILLIAENKLVKKMSKDIDIEDINEWQKVTSVMLHNLTETKLQSGVVLSLK